MKQSWLKPIGGFFLTALLCSHAWGSIPPQPGVINYIEGTASISGQPVDPDAVGSIKLEAGQSLDTQKGKAEILLSPGIFARIGENSSVQLVSPGLADTVISVNRGRALIEVDQIYPANHLVINTAGASTQIEKAGLYDFDADRGQMRVFDGQAEVQIGNQQVRLKGDHQLNANASGKLKPEKFDKKAYQDDLYRWASLRSSYLAEANVDAARYYGGQNRGYVAAGYGTGWYGTGWYWDPWYSAYTFIPGGGIFYSPFGWGYYSPWMAYGAPYLFVGGGFHHHFGPGYYPGHFGYRPGFTGHATSVPGSGFRGSLRGGSGLHGNGFSGGGIHGGGGGFHGGGGGGHR